jgi:serine/threonine protein kinase
LLSEGQLVGSYRVIQRLGGGGFATVWKVQHIHLKSLHALKVLRDDLASRKDIRLRFLDEGRIHAQLRHPGIVRATDIVVEDGIAGLVMDFREGLSLEQVIQEHPDGLDLELVSDLGLGLLSALEFAHGNGVVHRDIKPANIMISSTWDGRSQPVLLDFGIAQVRGALRSEGRGATQTGDKMGTPGYMSPEQLRSAADVDLRADLFGLGVVLLELATGSAPFARESDADTMVAVLAGDYVLPSAVKTTSPSLATAIERALASKRSDRWTSAGEMAEALRLRADSEADRRITTKAPIAQMAETPTESQRSAQGKGPPVRTRPVGALGLALIKLAGCFDGSLTPTTFVVPQFDETKLAAALSSYVPDTFGAVLVHHDSTVFGGAKEGLVVTTEGICSKASFEPPVQLAFSDTVAMKLTTPDNKLIFKGTCRNRREVVEVRHKPGSLSAALRLGEVVRLLQAEALSGR